MPSLPYGEDLSVSIPSPLCEDCTFPPILETEGDKKKTKKKQHFPVGEVKYAILIVVIGIPLFFS